jgi:hypothetical protein
LAREAFMPGDQNPPRQRDPDEEQPASLELYRLHGVTPAADLRS